MASTPETGLLGCWGTGASGSISCWHSNLWQPHPWDLLGMCGHLGGLWPIGCWVVWGLGRSRGLLLVECHSWIWGSHRQRFMSWRSIQGHQSCFCCQVNIVVVCLGIYFGLKVDILLEVCVLALVKQRGLRLPVNESQSMNFAREGILPPVDAAKVGFSLSRSMMMTVA